MTTSTHNPGTDSTRLAGTTGVRPLPSAVRSILRLARRRYHKERLPWRPSLSDPRSYVGLFWQDDLVALAKAGYWPLPERALALIARSPNERARGRCKRVNWVNEVRNDLSS